MKKNIIFSLSFLLVAGWLILGLSNSQAAVPDSVIITEFMANPTGTDTDKEWVEVYNLSGSAISLAGWKITDSANHTISGTYSIPNGGYAVICRTSDTSLNGGVNCQYTASLSLANTDVRTIILKDEANVEIDSVEYSGTVEGKSEYLSGGIWKTEEINTYGTGDYGTPGSANPGVGVDILNQSQGQLTGSVELEVSDVKANVSQDSAIVSFKMNASGSAKLYYGTTLAYGQTLTLDEVLANATATIAVNSLDYNTEYHYKIVGQSGDLIGESGDNTFTVGTGQSLYVDSISLIKANAKPDNTFENGLEWKFDITVNNDAENNLSMLFGNWTGPETISSADNLRFSVDNGATWQLISADNLYSASVNISGIDTDLAIAGRQISIQVQMKVPSGTLAGEYGADYGIKVE